MTENEIILIIYSQYINNASSNAVKTSLVGGDILFGEFIKAMQFKFNTKENKWMLYFYCVETDILLDGDKIISIIPISKMLKAASNSGFAM